MASRQAPGDLPQKNRKKVISKSDPWESIKGSVDSAPSGQSVSWSSISAELVSDAITAVTTAGDGISFSLSLSQEVYAIALLHQGKVKKFYDRDSEAVETYLTDIVAAYG